MILVSHGNPFFPANSHIVRTVDGGKTWTQHSVPFQVTGLLLFHPREEDWILGRGLVDGKVRKKGKTLALPREAQGHYFHLVHESILLQQVLFEELPYCMGHHVQYINMYPSFEFCTAITLIHCDVTPVQLTNRLQFPMVYSL